MSKNKSARAEIRKSRSKKNPFKVSVVAENGELTMTSELLSTFKNCTKNLLSTMKAFGGKEIEVWDMTRAKSCRKFILMANGSVVVITKAESLIN